MTSDLFRYEILTATTQQQEEEGELLAERSTKVVVRGKKLQQSCSGWLGYIIDECNYER